MGVRATGQRFVRPEFQLLIVLYAIHFALWVPVALRFATRAPSSQLLLVLAPVAVCFGISAIWLGVSYTLRKNNLSQGGPSFLPLAHLCLLAFTVLGVVIRVSGIFRVT
jgi:hypothetical protein